MADARLVTEALLPGRTFQLVLVVLQDLEMAEGYLPALKRFMKEVWPECNPRH